LLDSPSELERLRLQARVWEPEAEEMLDRLGLQEGWHCIDLGCGAMGLLGPLSRRAGPGGRVVGVDTDPKQLAAARDYVQVHGLTNVTVLERDAYNTGLPRESFDLTHVRFVFAPVGRDDELLREMIALTKPGGLIAVQEPDATAWSCYPPDPNWTKLKSAILAAFRQGGGDFDVGQRTFSTLSRAGLEDVQARAAVIALHDAHPYMRLPVQFATSLRKRILDSALLSEIDLDTAIAGCERVAADPNTFVLTFIVTQVWGRKPGHA
jgi:ubiquinone/menaquinone biosynthesis C-methylase UbiE